jgi:methionyl-tRNA formyltransferase
LRVAFAGTPEFALPALAALAARHEIVGVLTQPDRPQGRGRRLGMSPVKEAALARGLKLAQPPTLKSAEGRAPLELWAPQVLVVVAYGLILPQAALAIAPRGSLNIHASLLPRWRGAAPIQRALLAGDMHTGVTIMRINEGLDTGPMLLRRGIPIAADATGGSLHDDLATLGATLIVEALEALARGALGAEPQPDEGVTYAAKIDKAEARIDWGEDAQAIGRKVRAFSPWPIAETALSGQQLRIHAAHPLPDMEGNVLPSEVKSTENGTILAVRDEYFAVRCGRGALAVTEVQMPGRRRVTARDFSHSHALLGQRLG